MGKKYSAVRFTTVILITIAVFIAVDLGRKAMVYYRLRQDEAELRREIESEEAKQRELKRLRSYVRSDEFVEQWAREEAGMVKPGETAVVPIFVPETMPAPPE